MRIPKRQDELDALTRKYLREPKAEEDGQRHDPHTGVLSDEEIVAKLRGAKNAAKFSDLNDAGDTSAYDGDESRADLALMGMYAFYTQDQAQLERLFGDSALGQRPKWRNRPDYRRRTIDKALSLVTETYTPPRSRSQSLGNTGVSYDGTEDLKQSIQAFSFSGREKPGPREWLADNIIWRRHATSWFGEGGVAKSLLALHLGLTVAAENRSYWMAFAVKTVPVLYLDFELDADEQHRRALDLAAGMGLKGIPENFYYLSAATLPPLEAFKIAAEECRRLGIGLVIVDSVGFALEGDSETARDVLGFFRECIQPLKDAGASPLLIDHQAKIIKGEKYSDKQAFGSVYKTNAVRSSFQIRGLSEQGEITATFTHKKNNFGWKEKDFSLRIIFDSEAGRTTVERLDAPMPNPDRQPSKKELVLEAIEELGRATSETVAQKTGIPTQTVRNAISDLANEGAIVDTGEKQGRFRIYVTHSHTTKGPGPGATDEDDLFGADPTYIRTDENPLSADLAPGESATLDQLRRIRGLVGEGVSERLAREQVLGTGMTDEAPAPNGPKVVHYKREPYEEYIGRGGGRTGQKRSKWHNPFKVDDDKGPKDGTSEEVSKKFERYLLEGNVQNYEGKTFDGRHLLADVPEIRAKILGCHCAPEGGLTKDDPLRCHGQVLLRLANAEEDEGHPDDCVCDECLPI